MTGRPDRLQLDVPETEPLVQYYDGLGKLKVVNAEGDVDEVYERLVQAVS